MLRFLLSSPSIYISKSCYILIKYLKMKRNNRRTTRKKKNNMVLLPQELLVQILLRLPVKSLVRFKCVSKSWLSLISDPHFAISHFELAASPTHRLMFMVPETSEIRSIDFNASLHDDSASDVLNLNFLLPEPHSDVQIMGSCRGFILLSRSSNLCLWNPSTGSHKLIPLSPIESNTDAFLFTFLYGFGYDPSKDDYLMVLLSYDPNSADIATRVELFSLRANRWEEMEATHLSYMNCSDDSRVGVVLNGAIHWLAFRHDTSGNIILAFDLTERSFSEIPLPHDFYVQLDFCDLHVFGGFLSICCVGCHDPADIWVMEEYRVQSSWTKITVSVDHIPERYFSPICSTESGDIVGTDGRAGLVKINDKKQLHEHRYYSDDPYKSQVAAYTESLLSLPDDSEQAQEDN